MAVAGFKRKAILEAAREAVDNLTAEFRAWDERAELIRAEDRKKWVAEELPKVKEIRDRLSAALKKGGVITREQFSDLDRTLYRELDDYAIGHRIGYRDRNARKAANEKIVAYQGVIKLLEAQEGNGDDVLSISALQNLGINKLGELFRAAANKGGSVEKSPI